MDMPRWDATNVNVFSFLEFWIFVLLFMDKHSFPLFCGNILSHFHVRTYDPGKKWIVVQVFGMNNWLKQMGIYTLSRIHW